MKPPPTNRNSRMTSTTNNNYVRRPTFLPQSPSNGLKMNTTYLNTTQLYISQPSGNGSFSAPPSIPPRNLSGSNMRNSIIIPNFNEPIDSTTSVTQEIYRSPVQSSCIVPDHTHSSLINNENSSGEYFGKKAIKY